jgi:hypothetical protein
MPSQLAIGSRPTTSRIELYQIRLVCPRYQRERRPRPYGLLGWESGLFD